MQTHLTDERITAYLESPQANQFADVRTHLLNCATCRAMVTRTANTEAQKMSQLEQDLIRHIPQLATKETPDSDYLQLNLPAFLDHTLDEENNARVQHMINQDAPALKSALHFATHSAAMKRELESNHTQLNQAPPSTFSKEKTSFGDWISAVLSWNTPTWLSVPLTAMLAITMTVVLLPQSQNTAEESFSIAYYQDDASISFQKTNQAMPGIGFFGNAHKTHQAFSGIEAAISDNRLNLSWPKIKFAKYYQLQLSVYIQGKPLKVYDTKLTNNHSLIKDHDIQTDKRYVWELKGITKDEQVFSADGGFIISQ